MDLEIFWFCVVAFFWAGYLVLEGFDFGVGMLLPFLPRTEQERGVMFQSIGPVWDGNEVWLVVAGGATFAAFPAWYGTMFSGFYLALLLILVLLILRVVSFEWREKHEGPRARRLWLYANAAGSAGIALIWGVGLSNLLHGIPIDTSGDSTAGFWDLFSAYTVVGGLAFVALFAFHGAGFLTLRTTGDLCARATGAARRLAIPAVVLVVGYVAWTLQVATDANHKDLFPPVLPAAIAIIAIILAALLTHTGRTVPAFVASAVATLGVVATLFTSLYPRVMVSSTDFSSSLTVPGTASAHYTLAVMTVVALIATPAILVYQGWTYHVFRHRLGAEPSTDDTAPDLPAPTAG
jgi:cytochrome d ubiquinol oxidase subunit II